MGLLSRKTTLFNTTLTFQPSFRMRVWRCPAVVFLLLCAVRGARPGPACRISEFPCRNGGCVRLNGYCDGNDDCGDTSDEPAFCTGEWALFLFGIFGCWRSTWCIFLRVLGIQFWQIAIIRGTCSAATKDCFKIIKISFVSKTCTC